MEWAPYVHTYRRTYVHTCIRTYVHTHIRTYVHTYIRTARNKRSVAQQNTARDARVRMIHMSAAQPRGSVSRVRVAGFATPHSCVCPYSRIDDYVPVIHTVQKRLYHRSTCRIVRWNSSGPSLPLIHGLALGRQERALHLTRKAR